MWSELKNKTFTTIGRKPDRPPVTDIGAFFIEQDSSIKWFWKALDPIEHNEDNLQYYVSTPNSNCTTINSFRNVGRHTEAPIDQFKVYSKNDKGMSANYSSIFIANTTTRCQAPGDVTAISYDDGKRIRISWAKPENDNIVGYTVFWCRQGSDWKTCNVSYKY